MPGTLLLRLTQYLTLSFILLLFASLVVYRIKQFLSTEHTKIIVSAFVTSRLDKCNSLQYGLPCGLLQLVQNCEARLIVGGCKYDHITPLLRNLFWLPIEHPFTFKLLLITLKALKSECPLKPSHIENMWHMMKNQNFSYASQR